MPKAKKKTNPSISKSKPVASPAVKAASVRTSPRPIKLPPYRPIRFHKAVKPVRPPLMGAFRLFWRAIDMLKRHWQLFLGIALVYGALNILLVRGLASTSNIGSTKSSLNGILKGPSGKVSLGFTLFLSLLSGTGSSNSNASAGVYQTLIVIIVSLAVIWSLRQLYANEHIRIRDGFYRGMYPFVPFILVLLVVGLQLVPILIGGTLYNLIISNGIAVNVFQKLIAGLLFLLLALVSLYMISSSLFALYIVTLPDMTPMKALRSARQLVRYRRLIVLRKIIFLPLVLFALAAVIIIPISLLLTPVAEWVFFALSLVGIVAVHSYMYGLYRELLQ